MVIKVGINGFGRVGRIVFRSCFDHPDLEISAINDPAVEIDYICYLIKYDSTHGRLMANVTHTEDEIKIDNGKELCVKIFRERQPASIPWSAAGVQYVVEASGLFTDREKALGHLISNGVKRVILTAPSVDAPMVILGVNEAHVKIEHKILSCCSSTLYCLAPIAKVLEDRYGIDEGFITSIHAMTPSLKPLDGLCLRGKHWRDHRSISQNIIPAVTGACKALGRIVPRLKDRLCGLAFRVPIANVSVLDLTVRLKKNTTIANIVKDIEEINKSSKYTIIKTVHDDNVSSDFSRDTYSCILDVNSSMQLKPNSFKLICWYENEFSYACRVMDLIKFSENQFENCNTKNQVTVVKTRHSKAKVAGIMTPLSKLSSKGSNAFNICRSIRSPLSASSKKSTQTQIEYLIDNYSINESSEIKNDISASIHQDSSLHHDKTNSIINQNSMVMKHGSLEKVKNEYTRMVTITDHFLKIPFRHKVLHGSKNLNIPVPKRDHIVETTNVVLSKDAYTTVDSNINCSIHNVKHNSRNTTAVKRKRIDTKEDSKNDDAEITLHRSNCTRFDILNDCKTISLSNIRKSPKFTDPKKSGTESTKRKSREFDKELLLLRPQSANISIISKAFPKKVSLVAESNKGVAYKDTKSCQSDDEPPIVKQSTESTDSSTKQIYTCSTQSQITSSSNSYGIEGTLPKNEREHLVESICRTEIQQCEENRTEDVETGVGESDADLKNEETVDSEVLSEDRSRSIHLESGIASPLINTDSYVVLSDDVSKCSRSGFQQKQDIYDKLDSDSGSHSDDSFDINGKKSQVLKITDLTNSLEDLDRLDKICRIIEISDELSDRLFAVLDKEPSKSGIREVAKKKWSFKDLCEKINFDDFCKKVFVQK